MKFSKKDFKFFDIAKLVAAESTYGRIKIGAILVKNGKIISRGVNERKTHPLQAQYNKCRKIQVDIHHHLHAEMNAIIKAPHESLLGASIYVNRIRDNDYLICKPCKACQKAIIDFGIKYIYYTTNDGYAYEEII